MQKRKPGRPKSLKGPSVVLGFRMLEDDADLLRQTADLMRLPMAQMMTRLAVTASRMAPEKLRKLLA